MARETVTKRCSLCFSKVEDGKDLVCKDSLQLCPKCYERYNESAYNQRVMMLNSIKCYRQLVMRYSECSNVKIETEFNI